MVGNNLVANVGLNDFEMSLKWSNIGSLHMDLIQVDYYSFIPHNDEHSKHFLFQVNLSSLENTNLQPVVKTLVKTTLLPNANAYLQKGLPLPIVHGFMLQNTELVSSNSSIMVCTDMLWTKERNPAYLHYPYR